ncbi:MAG: O-antigen ligase family protein [Armatimonadota bacterium]|nr:O-antigen ligase family protein [Armatimonadota bacterium]
MTQAYRIAVIAAFLSYSSGYAGYVMPGLLAGMIVEAVTGRLRWVSTVMDRSLVLLLAAVTLSGLGSAWRGESLGLGVLFALMAAVSIYPAARLAWEHPAAIRQVAPAWIAGAIGAAAWGIVRAPATWPSGASTPALLGTALGTTLAAAVALALGAWTVWRRPALRAALAAGLVVMVTALTLTTSRSAWIAAAIGSVIVVALTPRARLGLVLLCAASVAVAMAATQAERSWLEHRIESIPSLAANADRVAIWRGAMRMIRDHPLTGIGYGTFVRAWPQYHDEPGLEGKPTAHNVFLNFAAETGLLGLAAFLAVVGTGFAALWRRVRTSRGDPEVDGLWTGVFAAMAAVMMQQLFDATIMSWHVGYALLAVFALAGPVGSRDAHGIRVPAT